MSWSEFLAGTLRAQLGHLEGESGGLNLAETRVRSVPREGLEPTLPKELDPKSSASASSATPASGSPLRSSQREPLALLGFASLGSSEEFKAARRGSQDVAPMSPYRRGSIFFQTKSLSIVLVTQVSEGV